MNESNYSNAHRYGSPDKSQWCGGNPNTCRRGDSNGCNYGAGADRVEGDRSFITPGADACEPSPGGHKASPAPELSMLAKAIRYAKAVRKWIAAGRPARKPEEVATIYRNECVSCENYKRDRSVCGICGCRVAELGPPLCNKVAMATEFCPLGKW